MLYKERGVFNRVQSSTVCNASATNFGRIPIFPPFSVTQTLINTTVVYGSEHRKVLYGLPGHLFWEVFAFFEELKDIL